MDVFTYPLATVNYLEGGVSSAVRAQFMLFWRRSDEATNTSEIILPDSLMKVSIICVDFIVEQLQLEPLKDNSINLVSYSLFYLLLILI